MIQHHYLNLYLKLETYWKKIKQNKTKKVKTNFKGYILSFIFWLVIKWNEISTPTFHSFIISWSHYNYGIVIFMKINMLVWRGKKWKKFPFFLLCSHICPNVLGKHTHWNVPSSLDIHSPLFLHGDDRHGSERINALC